MLYSRERAEHNCCISAEVSKPFSMVFQSCKPGGGGGFGDKGTGGGEGGVTQRVRGLQYCCACLFVKNINPLIEKTGLKSASFCNALVRLYSSASVFFPRRIHLQEQPGTLTILVLGERRIQISSTDQEKVFHCTITHCWGSRFGSGRIRNFLPDPDPYPCKFFSQFKTSFL